MTGDVVSRNEYIQLKEFFNEKFAELHEQIKGIGTKMDRVANEVNNVKTIAVNALSLSKSLETQVNKNTRFRQDVELLIKVGRWIVGANIIGFIVNAFLILQDQGIIK